MDDHLDVINVRYGDNLFYSLVVRNRCTYCPNTVVERIREEIARVGSMKSHAGLNWGAAAEILSPDHYEQIGLELVSYVAHPSTVDHDEIIALSSENDDDIPF